MTIRRVPMTRLSPATAASAPGFTPLWEGRIASGSWSYVQVVMSITPVHEDPGLPSGHIPTVGSHVLIHNITSNYASDYLRVRFPNPHFTIMWDPYQPLEADDIIQIASYPIAEGSALWVDSAVLTVSDRPIPATGTPPDPEYVAPVPGWGEARWGEAQWDIDNWQEA